MCRTFFQLSLLFLVASVVSAQEKGLNPSTELSLDRRVAGQVQVVAAKASAPRFLGEWGKKGSEPGEFHFPIGIALNAADEIFVTDFYNARVQKNHRVQKFGVAAAGDEPKSPVSRADADRNAQKIPTKIAGTYKGGELIELRVRDRTAYVIKPTGKVDPQKRWLWDFPFWLAINDGFGNVAHRYYVEKALAAGFHIAGIDVGPSCGSPAAAEVCQEFYEQLVSEHGLHKRARVLAHSHGGLIAYGWAFRHPACVNRIGGNVSGD
jgi:hypothetical protein